MITSKGARDLLKDVHFPGDVDSTYLISVSRQRRRELVRCGGRSQDTRLAATIEIQRFWRGFRTRCKLWAIFGNLRFAEVSSPLKVVPSTSSTQEPLKSPRQLHPKLSAQYRDYVQWCLRQGLELESKAILSFEDYAARVIQSWWRHLARHNSSEELGKDTNLKTRVLDEGSAATVIQRSWRKHNDIKVFKFYRDLINFQGRGNPSLMLRSINPAESKLLDQASGTFVRFRLGGIKFPPNIYYKIFTQQPIVDMCAFSPRDYTAMVARQQLGRERHNKPGRSIEEGDSGEENWYSRVENNGWRLVSDRIFLSPFQDPITVDTSKSKYNFHYSKLQRRQDTHKKQKQRKIEWLKKMYKEGALQAREGLSEATSSAVDLATKELVSLTESQGADSVEETDIDELLRWTNGLNYDQYVSQWHSSASSALSNDKCHADFTSNDDPV